MEQLRGALQAHPRAASCILDAHLPPLLQLPSALRLLLRAVPAGAQQQAAVYRRLCRCLDAGMQPMLGLCMFLLAHCLRPGVHCLANHSQVEC